MSRGAKIKTPGWFETKLEELSMRLIYDIATWCYVTIVATCLVMLSFTMPEAKFQIVTVLVTIHTALMFVMSPSGIEQARSFNVVGKIAVMVTIAFYAWPLPIPLSLMLLVGCLVFWFRPPVKSWNVHTSPMYRLRIRLGLIALLILFFLSRESVFVPNELVFLAIASLILFFAFVWGLFLFMGILIGNRTSKFIAETGEQIFDLLPIACMIEVGYAWQGFWGVAALVVAYLIIERCIPRRFTHE